MILYVSVRSLPTVSEGHWAIASGRFGLHAQVTVYSSAWELEDLLELLFQEARVCVC